MCRLTVHYSKPQWAPPWNLRYFNNSLAQEERVWFQLPYNWKSLWLLSKILVANSLDKGILPKSTGTSMRALAHNVLMYLDTLLSEKYGNIYILLTAFYMA